MIPEKVEAGQVWKDNDQRSVGSGEFIVDDVVLVTNEDGETYPVAFVTRTSTRRKSRIKVSRLIAGGNRGYSYLGKSR